MENDKTSSELALWPEQWPTGRLEAKRRELGTAIFNCMFMGDTQSLTGSVFKTHWLRYYQRNELPKLVSTVQAWDTALKTGQDNDFSVCMTAGKDAQGRIYLMDMLHAKMESPELERSVVEQYRRWKPGSVVVEDAVSGTAVLQKLRRTNEVPVRAARGAHAERSDKMMRARTIAPYFERGDVMLPAEAPWLAEFEAEVCGFPLAPHDDIVDATAYAILELTNTGDSFGEYLELLKRKTQ